MQLPACDESMAVQGTAARDLLSTHTSYLFTPNSHFKDASPLPCRVPQSPSLSPAS